MANYDGNSLDFLNASFDSLSGIVKISLPNPSSAVKGNYTL